MKHYINNQGQYQQTFTDYALAESLGFTEVPNAPPTDMTTPRYIDNEWVETATAEEIEAIEEAKIPTKLRNYQVREALIDMGIMPSVIDAEIEKLESPDKDIVWQMWNFRDEISRKNPYVIQLAETLNIDLKQLFTIGNQIN